MAKEDLRSSILNGNKTADPRKRLFQEQLGLPTKEEETIPAPETEPERRRKRQPLELSRKTFFLTPELIEAIRIYSFEERTDISETVRILLMEAMPEKYITAARKNLN